MKRFGRLLGSLLAVMLAVCSLQALAAGTQMAGRDFDHTATGFPLTGVHALVPCETCHVAGVFKGTPKVCDGCHALGKRVVATPKSTNHIVTDAPCDSCHFNASTFLGARFNHGTAVPGQCKNCHNGRQSVGKPASHSSGNKATQSCDQCHRSFTWFNASWNHAGIPMGGHTCAQSDCHAPGSGNLYTYATATSPVNHSSYTDTMSKACDVCHVSFVTWTATMHEPQTGTCSSCHNGANAQGPRTDHTSFAGWPIECNVCHTSTSTWLGALGNKPANHIPDNSAPCSVCHLGTSVATDAALHGPLAGMACTTCHLKGASYYWPNHAPTQKAVGHEGMKAGDDCIKCHRVQYNQWNKP